MHQPARFVLDHHHVGDERILALPFVDGVEKLFLLSIFAGDGLDVQVLERQIRRVLGIR